MTNLVVYGNWQISRHKLLFKLGYCAERKQWLFCLTASEA